MAEWNADMKRCRNHVKLMAAILTKYPTTGAAHFWYSGVSTLSATCTTNAVKELSASTAPIECPSVIDLANSSLITEITAKNVACNADNASVTDIRQKKKK